ncbi:MAG: MBL fold metallo-hydrolase [Planctomycetota bacterium]|jgi:phosphoribosyl 1,2-cyclic phosphate phosphodiesterase
MEFIFMGTGTSGGVPMIACDCDTCTSDDPRDTRTRTGACVRWVDSTGQQRVVLIDTTPDLREQAMRHRLERCDAILFTHNHVDHIFGLDEVRRFNAVMPRMDDGSMPPIDIYAEDHTMDALRRVYAHIFDQEANVNKSFVATLVPNRITPGEPIEIHGVRFTPVRLMHGNLPIVGFRIEAMDASIAAPWMTLAYCTDVSEIPDETWSALEGLSTLVLDGLRWDPHPTHLTIEQACLTARRIGAGRTWLVHVAHQVRHEEGDTACPAGIRLAWDGLVLD